MAKRRKSPDLGSKKQSSPDFEAILSKSQATVLKLIAPVATANNFYLAGGAALALQIFHRRSRDFDFFTAGKFDNIEKFLKSMKSAGIEFNVQQTAQGTLFGTVNGIEMSFIRYDYPILNSKVRNDNYTLEMVTLLDIAAMKMSAVVQRGLKRDFVDVYALLKSGVTLQQMLDSYKRKYGFDNKVSILMALSYFDDAEAAEMPDMIWTVKWDEVKKYISKAVTEFARKA